MGRDAGIHAASRERDGRLCVAAHERRSEVVVHASVSRDGALSVSVARLPAPRDAGRLLDGILSGARDGLPGNLPRNVPGHPDPRWRAGGPHDIRRVLEAGTGLAAVEALSRRLDGRVMSLASVDRHLSTDAYCALVADPSARRDVLDLAERHPWILDGIPLDDLVAYAASPGGAATLARSGDLAALRLFESDRWRGRDPSGTPGWPIAVGAVRASAGAWPRDVSRLALQFLSALPPDWVPERGSRGWAEACALSRLAGSAWCAMPADLPALLAGSRGDFKALGRRILEADPAPRLWESVARTEDLYRAFARDVLGPLSQFAGIARRDLPAVAKAFLGIGTVVSLAEVSRRWHAQERAIRLAVEPSDRRSWPALTKPFRTRGRLDVVALCSAAELDAEGLEGVDADGVQGLDHCVGGRADGCARGQSHVFSVRRSAGRSFRRLSTFEVDVAGGVPRVVEHQGRGNTHPPAESAGAVRDWLDAVEGGKLALDPRALERLPPSWHGQESPEERLARALPAWSGLLRRRYRYLPPLEAGLAAIEAADEAAARAARAGAVPKRRVGPSARTP